MQVAGTVRIPMSVERGDLANVVDPCEGCRPEDKIPVPYDGQALI